MTRRLPTDLLAYLSHATCVYTFSVWPPHQPFVFLWSSKIVFDKCICHIKDIFHMSNYLLVLVLSTRYDLVVNTQPDNQQNMEFQKKYLLSSNRNQSMNKCKSTTSILCPVQHLTGAEVNLWVDQKFIFPGGVSLFGGCHFFRWKLEKTNLIFHL